jgi:hypothetical protein
MASASEEPYTRAYVIISHSEVVQPIAQVPVPLNMTVTTPCSMNEVATGRIQDIIDGFKPLFTKIKYTPSAFGIFGMDAPPTEHEIKSVLMGLRSNGDIGAIRNNAPVIPVFTQRKNEAPFTRQMCFMPGSAVRASIIEFSKESQDGVDITNRLLVSGGVQIYRPANVKDAIIIDIEKTLMSIDRQNLRLQQPGIPHPFVNCTSEGDILFQSKGKVTKEDIADLYNNRWHYCHAIGLKDPPTILCSFDIDQDVEPLRLSILNIIQAIPELVSAYFKDAVSNENTRMSIIRTLKTDIATSKLINPLVGHLIFSVLNGIRRDGGRVSDPKIVHSGYEQIPSDELLRRIHLIHPHDRAYVFILGCRCIQTSDPTVLSRTRSSDTQDPRIEYFGGKRMRARKTTKRKLLYKLHKRKLHRKKTTRSKRR